ncbi:hypothetical protein CAPTEDRAFT_198976 [Capitella teleta]|uniref:Uncharacterized protein n=1 Tax=Capitella teleta TaxID=283909 RepID=R7TML3_CAPTE|nr:hypothetical protein CAPTEDRAFT_198976 [Capitella teleta]|eukprot:ELT92305.1 hypothetical protein CAPTEDRAFT_198976 [Capitella teleta]
MARLSAAILAMFGCFLLRDMTEARTTVDPYWGTMPSDLAALLGRTGTVLPTRSGTGVPCGGPGDLSGLRCNPTTRKYEEMPQDLEQLLFRGHITVRPVGVTRSPGVSCGHNLPSDISILVCANPSRETGVLGYASPLKKRFYRRCKNRARGQNAWNGVMQNVCITAMKALDR